MNKNKLWVFAIFLTGLILRIFMIGSRGIWYDDAFSILLARQDLSQIISGTAADTMPPLYYFILHFWMLILDDIWWLRLLSVLLSICGMFILFLVVKEIGGWQAAAWATLLAAVSPLQIYHAQELRMYALMQIMQAAYIYSFLKIYHSEKNTGIFWTVLLLAGVLSLYSHNLAVLFLQIPNIILVFQKNWRLLAKLLLAQIIIFVLFLPWAFFVPGQLQKIQTAFWTPTPGLLEVSRSAAEMLGSLYAPNPYVLIIFAFSLIVFVCMTIFFYRNRKISAQIKTILLCLIFLVPVELFMVSYLIRPIFVTRGFITSSLFFCGLAGLLIAGYQRKAHKLALASTVIFIGIMSLPAQIFQNSFPRSQFDEALDSVSFAQSDEQIILHDNKLSYFPSLIYHPEARQAFLPDEPFSPNDTFAPASQVAMEIHPQLSLSTAVNNYKNVEFVVFLRTIDEYRNMGITVHPVIQRLKEQYSLRGISEHGDLLIYHFYK
jgi:mannosyltransferase